MTNTDPQAAVDRRRGSLWRRWDFQLHTPASYLWRGERLKNPREGADAAQARQDLLAARLLAKLESTNIDVFIVTDYFTLDGYFWLRDYVRAHPAMQFHKTLLPGVELRLIAPMPTRLNAQVVFDPSLSDDRLREFLDRLLIGYEKTPLSRSNVIAFARGLTPGQSPAVPADLTDANEDEKLLWTGYEKIELDPPSLFAELDRLPTGHATVIQPYELHGGVKRVRWDDHPGPFNQLIDRADAIETRHDDVVDIFSLRETDANRSFLAQVRRRLDDEPKACVCSTDAHSIDSYGTFPGGFECWLKADPSYEGLLAALSEPRARVHVGTQQPPGHRRVSESLTKHVQSLSVRRTSSASTQEDWFTGTVPVNPYLVAIIGAKGSGKSAFADMIALAANARCEAWEFLNDRRFRSVDKRAEQFEVEATWGDGRSTKSRLSDDHNPAMPARARYVTQSSIDKICDPENHGRRSPMELELVAAIYAHLPENERLSSPDLDDVVQRMFAPDRAALDEARSELAEINRRIIAGERAASPDAVNKARARLTDLEAELASLDKAKPPQPQEPKSSDAPEIAAARTAVATLEERRKGLAERRAELDRILVQVARKQEAVSRVSQRVKQVADEHRKFLTSCAADGDLLGVDLSALAKVSIDFTSLEEIRLSLTRLLESTRIELGSLDTGGLVQAQAQVEADLGRMSAELSAPQRAYQQQVEAIRVWTSKRERLVGSSDRPDTVEHARAVVRRLAEELPGSLEALRERRREIAARIAVLVASLRDLKRRLCQHVNDYIAREQLASHGFPAEFYVSSSVVSFRERLFRLINRAKAGPFRGEGGNAAVAELIRTAVWTEPEGWTRFADAVVSRMTADAGTGGAIARVERQLADETSPEDLLNFLYGFDYIEPYFAVRFDQKELPHLSPGERGALLIGFLLHLDRSDVPLIIDQPEHNLDNESVYAYLVPSFQFAKNRRQIIIVTHNPNLAVVCDAEQVIRASFDRPRRRIAYDAGAIENPAINRYLVNVLEGTWRAFSVRRTRYRPTRLNSGTRAERLT